MPYSRRPLEMMSRVAASSAARIGIDQGEQRDAGAEPDVVGLRGGGRHCDHRRGQDRELADEVHFGEPGGVEADPVGVDDLSDGVAIALGDVLAVGLGKLEEQSKLGALATLIVHQPAPLVPTTAVSRLADALTSGTHRLILDARLMAHGRQRVEGVE